MPAPLFSFGTEQFNRIFPFYIVINSELKITSTGKSLSKLYPVKKGKLLTEFFQLKSPQIEQVTFNSLKNLGDEVVVLSFKDANYNHLRGQFEYLDEQNQLLFIGAPCFSSMDEVTKAQLSINDFARHDTLIDQLNVLEAQETISKDIKNLVKTASEQKNAVAENGEKLWEFALKGNGEGIWKYDFKNEKGIGLTQNNGLPDDEEDDQPYTYSKWLKAIHPDDLDKVNVTFEAYLNGEIPHFNIEHRLMDKDDYKYFVTRGIIVEKDEEGKPSMIIGTMTDIHHQKQLELQLKDIETQKIFFESILNNMPADVVVYNPDHQYIFVSPAAISDPELRKWMIGKKDEEFCSHRNKGKQIAEERKKLFKKVLTSKKIQSWEEKVTSVEGTSRYLLRSMYPVLNEQREVIQVIGLGLDITNFKKIEDQLRINEKRYRDLFNYSQAFICTHDMNGKFLTVNPAVCDLLGFTSEELVGKTLMDFLPKEDVNDFHTGYLDKVITDGLAKGVFRIIGKNNTKHFLLYKNFKVEEENSEPYVIGFSQDITDRIRTEKELMITKRVTEDAHRAKETFLANMSHEIRTPMTGILGIANLLSKTELDEQQMKFTKLISESANNLLTIVNDVLDIEKITAGKLDLESIPFRLEEKVFTTLQSFQFKAEDRSINLLLKSTLPDDLIVVGDPYRLSQILNNLLSNALKFTNEGEITIILDYRKNETKNIIVEIQVQDTGIGIKPEKLADIFHPFVQGSSDTTRKFGGTGLGLAICKNLVEMQGGKITVGSKLNEGTTFSFYIPYEKGTEAMLPEEKKEALNFKDLESMRILVAEDVELNQFLVKHILESWGCEVTIVSNGKEAVEKVKKSHFDLILMDIQMPEMDGITATKIIRTLNMVDNAVTDKSVITKKIRTFNAKDKSTIPIIALTANALKGDGQKYMDIGMNGYITKPYTEEKLFMIINEVIKSNDKLRLKVTQPKNPADKPGDEVEKLYDLSLINTIGKDDPVFTQKIIAIFLETMPESLDSLMAARSEKNYSKLAKITHKMKSSIDSMGIHSLADPIRELEATTGENDNLDTNIAKINSTLKAVFVQLSKMA